MQSVGGLRQNEHVVSQAVVRPSPGADFGLHVDLVPADARLSATTGHGLHLGSQDLIRFAGYATQHGFRVVHFDVADSQLTPLDADDQREVSDAMVAILREYGDEELDAAMRDDFDGLYVVGVELLSLANGLRIDVRRSGYVDTSVVEEAERLLDSAWRELRLS